MLFIGYSIRVRNGNCVYFTYSAKTFSGLDLYKSCAYWHNLHEFISILVLLCRKALVFFASCTFSGTSTLSASYSSAFSETWEVWFYRYIPFLPEWSRWFHSVHRVWLRLSVFAICSYLLQEEDSLSMVEQRTDIWVEHMLFVANLLTFFVRTVVLSLPIVSRII